jgi:hypothetical protein
MNTEPNTHTDTRHARSHKPTVQLRRPTCTELAGRPDLVAQLVLAVSES